MCCLHIIIVLFSVAKIPDCMGKLRALRRESHTTFLELTRFKLCSGAMKSERLKTKVNIEYSLTDREQMKHKICNLLL